MNQEEKDEQDRSLSKAYTTYLLAREMRYGRDHGYSFNSCLAEARKQFNREVREAADARDLNEVAK